MLATGRVGLLSERQVVVIRQGETLNCPCSWLRGGFQVLSKEGNPAGAWCSHWMGQTPETGEGKAVSPHGAEF